MDDEAGSGHAYRASWLRLANRALASVLAVAAAPAVIRVVDDPDAVGRWAVVGAAAALVGSAGVEAWRDRRRTS